MIPRELRTERLLLRQWRESDAEPLAAIYAQPEFLEHMPALDLDMTRAQIDRFQRQWEVEGFSHWAAEDAATGELIGRIGLLRHHDWPLADSPVEVGWALHRGWWGRGLATEGGAEEVGRSTTAAVVRSIVLIIAADLFVTALFYVRG